MAPFCPDGTVLPPHRSAPVLQTDERGGEERAGGVGIGILMVVPLLRLIGLFTAPTR